VRAHDGTRGPGYLDWASDLRNCRFSWLSGVQPAPAVSAARQTSRTDRLLTQAHRPRVNRRAFECPVALRGDAPIGRKGRTPRRAGQSLSTGRRLGVAESARAGGRLPFGIRGAERRVAPRRAPTQLSEGVSARGSGSRPFAAQPLRNAGQSDREKPGSSCRYRCSIAAALLDQQVSPRKYAVADDLCPHCSEVRPRGRLRVCAVGNDTRDDAVALPEFHCSAGTQPSFQPACVPELANVYARHESIVTRRVSQCQTLSESGLLRQQQPPFDLPRSGSKSRRYARAGKPPGTQKTLYFPGGFRIL